MALQFSPFLPGALIAGLIAIYLVITLSMYQRYKPILSDRYWRLLIGCKVVSAAAVALLLLNPSVRIEVPDKSRFRIVFLLDASGSMNTRDCNKRSRIDVLRDDIVDAESPFHKRMAERFEQTRYSLFAGNDVRRLDVQSEFASLPGDTDIDGSLSAVLAQNADQVGLGAVVLVSDGIDNVGQALMETALPYREAGVPIHCIGVGDSRPRQDIGVYWTTTPRKTRKGASFPLTATIKRNFNGDHSAKLEVLDGGRVVQSRNVEFAENERSLNMEFDHTAFTSGFKTYKIQVEQLPDEENVVNNVDFAGITVSDPDVFSILYFSGNLNWDYKFLRRLTDDQERLELDAVIRLGEDHWFSYGVGEEDETVEGFPELAKVNEYDCLMIDVSSLYLLETEQLDGLRNFVDNRGGGIIFTGLAETLDASVLEMFPLTGMPTELAAVQQQAPLAFKSSRMFSGSKTNPMHHLEARLKLPVESMLYRINEDAVKPGAKVGASVKGPGWPVAIGHNYGAGKVAYINLNDTWKWVMSSDNGDADFGQFWGRLVSWVSSSSLERMVVRPYASKLTLAREQQFKVDVLDDNFKPDNSAVVTCRIRTPDGQFEDLQLIPNPKVDGRYVGTFIGREIGEYRMTFTAKLSGSETVLEQVSDYVVVDLSAESQPGAMAEPHLQNLARATGGTYWNYKDLAKISDFKLNNQIKRVEDQHHWLDTWLFLVLVLLAVLPDWYYRRKIGLR
jgi:hypothetical protein